MRLASTRDLSFHSSSDCSVDFVNNDQAKLFVDHIASISPTDFRYATKNNYNTNINQNHENDVTKESHTTHNNYANRRIKQYSSNINNDQEEYLEKELEKEWHKSNENLYTSDTLHTSYSNHNNELNEEPKRHGKSSMHTITPSSSFVSAFSTEINREQIGKIGIVNTSTTSLSLTATPRRNEQRILTSRMLHDKMEQTTNATEIQERIDRGNSNQFMPTNTNIESIEHNDEEQEEPLEKEEKEAIYSPFGWFGFVGNAASHGLSAIEEYLDHVLLDTEANTQKSKSKQRNSVADDNKVKSKYRKMEPENNKNISKWNFFAKNRAQEQCNNTDKSGNALVNSEWSRNNNNGAAIFNKYDESSIRHEIHVPDLDHKAHVELGRPPIRSSMQANMLAKEQVNEHRNNYNKYEHNHDDGSDNYYYEQHENNSISSLSSGFGGIFNTINDSATMNSRSNNLQTPISVSVNDGNVGGSIDTYAKSAHNALEHSEAKFSSENHRSKSHYHSSSLHASHEIHVEPTTHHFNDHTINTEADHDDLHSPRVVQIHSQYMPCDGELPLGAQQIILSSEQLARIERRCYSCDYDTNKVKNRTNDTQGKSNNNITSTLQNRRAKETDNNNYVPFNNNSSNYNNNDDDDDGDDNKRNSYNNYHNNNINISNYDDSQMEFDTDSRDRGISRSDNDEDHEYDEYPAVEVDLISGLRGYREYPNEWYGHLVAAALNTRSLPNNPVTASELAEAGHNPFLVRLIVNSNALNTDDPLVRQNVQETVDALIEMHNDGADPALYEYLVNFLPITYIRLTHKQSAQLKSNGFEYIKLMYDNKHVLPSGNGNSIFFNYSFAVLLTNFIVAVIDLAAIVLCTIVIALSVAKWMDPRINDNQQSYGFYTLLVFGCGYAARLIIILFIVKRKPNEFVYERANNLSLPSPYLYAVPVLPLFYIMCLVTFVQALHDNYVILAHNSLVASRLASVCFAVTFGFPQLITHSFLESNLNPNEHKERWRYVFTFLIVTVFVQWTLALLRFAWMTLMYESITGLGFARFNIRHSHRPFRYVSLFLHILHLISVFLIESDIYLIIACNIKFGRAEHDCTFLPVTITVLASIPIIFFLALYSWLVFSDRSSFLITLVDSFLFAVHIGIFTLSFDPVGERCTVFRSQIFHQYYTFGFGSLIVYWFVIACIVLTALMYFIVRLAESKDHEEIYSTHFVTHSAAEPFTQYEKSAQQQEENGHLLPQCVNETDCMTAVQYGRIDTQNNVEPSNFTFTAPDANNTVPARITRALTSTGNNNVIINNSKSSEESSEQEELESSSSSNAQMHPLPLLSSSLMSQSTTEQISSSTSSSSVSTVTRTAVKAAVNTKKNTFYTT